MLKKIFSSLMAVVLVVGLCPTVALADTDNDINNYAEDVTQQFDDVKSGEWYTEHVQWCYDENVMTGYNNTTWGVGHELTRAELATILWRYSEPGEYANYNESTAKNETTMPDVADGTYYTEAANWAWKKGIFTGHDLGNGQYIFDPNGSTTREQAATVLWRWVGSPSASTSTMLSFPDVNSVSGWAASAVAWATYNDIITGSLHEDGTYWIDPARSILREEMAKVFHLSVKTNAKSPYDPSTGHLNVNSIAAFGNYALIVQMIGGDGALAATDAVTLSNLQSSGIAVSATVAWSDSSGDASSINADAIIESGAKAILVADYESYSQSIPRETLQYLEDKGVVWVQLPNLSSSVNIKKCVNWVGEMLQGSSIAVYGADTENRASYYAKFHDRIVSGANGGLANDQGYNRTTNKVFQTSDGYSYDADGLGFSDNTATYTVLVNDWEPDAQLHITSLTFDPGLGFASVGYAYSPFSYYMQAGGTINLAAANNVSIAAQGETPVLQFAGSEYLNLDNIANLGLQNIYLSGGVFSVHPLLDSRIDFSEMSQIGKGLGSDVYPKLLVASSEIKDNIVANSWSSNSVYHPYGYSRGNTWGEIPGISYNNGQSFLPTSIGSKSLGGQSDWEGRPNDCYPEGYIYESDILVNPSGYFCDWTSGSVESFLESGWIASRINGVYDYAQWQQDVRDFYSWAWGINVDLSRIDVN